MSVRTCRSLWKGELGSIEEDIKAPCMQPRDGAREEHDSMR